MAIVNELVTLLRYQVDNSGLNRFNAGMAGITTRARGVMGYMRSIGTAARQGLVEGIRNGVTQHRALVASQSKALTNTRAMAGGYSAIAGHLQTIIAGFGAMASARIADDWASVNSRVELAVDPTEVKSALDEIYAIAQATGQQYLATGDLFGKLARNQKELGLATSDSLALTKIINEAMVVGGGSQASQAAALTQLGQALGSGVLRGDELNSIIEQSPRLAQAIAKAFDVPVGKLKELGEKGQLSAKILAKGLLEQAGEINAEFAKMPRTFSRGWTTIMNAYGKRINEINRSTRAAERFNRITDYIAANMREIINIGAFSALAFALTKLRPIAMASLAPFLRMAAVLAGIYLIAEDISVWAQGGESVFGKLFGAFDQWTDTIDYGRSVLESIKNLIGDSSDSMTQFVSKWGAILVSGYALIRVLGFALRGLGLLFGPIRWILMGVAAVVGLIGLWPTLIIAAIAAMAAVAVYIYKQWDDIKVYINSIWDDITEYFTNLWDGAVSKVSGWIKGLFGDWAILSEKQGAEVREKEGKSRLDQMYGGIDNLQKGYGGAVQTPQSFSPSQNNQVTNEITINAQTSSPASLANAAAQAAGTATTRSLSRSNPYTTPNVEVMA